MYYTSNRTTLLNTSILKRYRMYWSFTSILTIAFTSTATFGEITFISQTRTVEATVLRKSGYEQVLIQAPGFGLFDETASIPAPSYTFHEATQQSTISPSIFEVSGIIGTPFTGGFESETFTAKSIFEVTFEVTEAHHFTIDLEIHGSFDYEPFGVPTGNIDLLLVGPTGIVSQTSHGDATCDVSTLPRCPFVNQFALNELLIPGIYSLNLTLDLVSVSNAANSYFIGDAIYDYTMIVNLCPYPLLDCDGDGVFNECEDIGPILFVDKGAIGANNGSSWLDAYNNPQAALVMARCATELVTEIWVAAGTYKPDFDPTTDTYTGDRAATFQLLNGVALLGGFAGNEDPATFDVTSRDFVTNETILSGDLLEDDGPNFANNSENSYHVVTGSGTDATAILDGFTITGGFANETVPNNHGAGILIISGSPTLNNCAVSYNRTGDGIEFICDGSGECVDNGRQHGGNGAGIYCESGSPNLSACTLVGNTTGIGWSDYYSIYQFGQPGQGGNGAGVYIVNSSLLLTSCMIVQNISGNGSASILSGGDGGSGAAIFAKNSILNLNDCNISNNRSGDGGRGAKGNPGLGGSGGGICVAEDTILTVTECNLSSNSTGSGGPSAEWLGSPAGDGGAIYCTFSRATINSSTIIGNTTGSGGGSQDMSGDDGGSGAGIFADSASLLTMIDCIVRNNVTGTGGRAGSGGNGGNGGGIALSSGIVDKCLITSNSTGNGGPGEYANQFLSHPGGGSGGYGAGVYIGFPGTVAVAGSIISRNNTGSGGSWIGGLGDPFPGGNGGNGAGVYCTSATEIANCTVVENMTGLGGTGGNGGADGTQGIVGGIIAELSISIENSILWANQDVDGVVESSQLFGTSAIDYSCVQGWTGIFSGVGNFGDDPELDVDKIHLLDGSPCINSGDPGFVAQAGETDIDGESRIQQCRVDIGADESPYFRDCQPNGNADACELQNNDCNNNGIPDDCESDSDGDGIIDVCDNCLNTINPAQVNSDSDPYGDLCDNCSLVVNPLQDDVDVDGDGDKCDICPGDINNLCNPDGSTAVEIPADNGGTVQTPDGDVTIDIDPGDFEEDTTISITETVMTDPEVDLLLGASPGLGSAVAVYVFESNGVVFLNSVTITIVKDVSILNQNQRSRFKLYVFEGQVFVDIGATCILSENPPGTFIVTCTAEIDHFSIYGAIVPLHSDDDGIPDDFDGIKDNCPNLNNPNQFDCDVDGVGDLCAIANGMSFDGNGNDIPDECEFTIPLQPLPDQNSPGTLACSGGDNYGLPCMACIGGSRDGSLCIDSTGCTGGGTCAPDNTLCPDATCGGTVAGAGSTTFSWPKNRYLGFKANSTWTGSETAIHIRLVSTAGHPDCDGEYRWIGPPIEYCEGADCTVTFWASELQPTPYWADWTSFSPDNTYQVIGEEIVPGSRYAIQALDRSSENDLGIETNYSNSLMINTAKWGDVDVPLSGFTAATQPSISDVLKIVDKWLGNLEPRKSRTQLQPAVLNPTVSVSIADVIKGVDAWLGTPYPYSITTCTP